MDRCSLAERDSSCTAGLSDDDRHPSRNTGNSRFFASRCAWNTDTVRSHSADTPTFLATVSVRSFVAANEPCSSSIVPAPRQMSLHSPGPAQALRSIPNEGAHDWRCCESGCHFVDEGFV